MNNFQNILVATDTTLDDHPIVAEVAEIALRNGAKLKIVDVVPDLPWTVRLTLKDHAHYTELICQEKEAKLAEIASPIRARGIEVETKALQGASSLQIIQEVLRDQHDLVLRVAKGSTSRSAGTFGNTAMRLLRQCPCPVWLVAAGAAPKFHHIAGCVDTSSSDTAEGFNERIFELAKSISEYHGAKLSIVHAWSMFGAHVLKWKMEPDEYQRVVATNRQHALDRFHSFLETFGTSTKDGSAHLLDGDTGQAISDFVQQNSVDLLVMGTVARSGLSGAVMGNTAEQILGRVKCSVLAIKPESFVCPITLN